MKRLVLIGAGHAHALVLDALHKQPLSGVELTLVSPESQAPYSGMVPGWLAGQYSFEQTLVDFIGLCERAGAKLLRAELVSLNPDSQQLALSDGQMLSYDWLSINVGSTLRPPPSQTPMLAMRPLSSLKQRYERWLKQWQESRATTPLRLTSVGGGAASVESLLCIKHRLQQMQPDTPVHAQLVSRGMSILPGFSSRARRLAFDVLKQADVTLQLGTAWCETIAQSSDLIIWATGAEPHAWQIDRATRGNLKVDQTGFITVNACLQSISHKNVFAVGDCASLPHPIPKAGVYAVRMGTTLAANLRSAANNQPLSVFKHTGPALALLNTANGKAIASWGPLGWQAQWAMGWKDRIDRRFIHRFVC